MDLVFSEKKCSKRGCKNLTTYKYCIPCATEMSKKFVAKKYKDEELERKKKYRENTKTYTQKVNEVKKVFQAWVRKRDENLPCISCGATYSNPCWDGGHYKKAEKYRGVIFHVNNCHKQCRQCNFFMDGNESNYREKLVIKIGEENVKELEALSIETKDKKYSNEELLEITELYKKLAKELKKDTAF